MNNSKSPSRLSRSTFTALLFILLPFVAAFDFPDTTGVHGRISAGRGTYSISSCSRSFRSEYIEENLAVRATFATGSDEPELAKRLQPGKTTFGAYGNWVQEELRLVREDGGPPERPATPKADMGQSYGAYAQFDWPNFGLQIGAISLSQWEPEDERHINKFVPTAEVRLGPEYLYAGASLLSSTPVLSGGGGLQGGVGGRKGNTRIWGGLSIFPVRENSLTLKLSQKIGPATLSLAGQWAMEASNYDATHEHGLSMGLDVPLSKA
ncbi:MAG: hypothetical protein ABIW76_19010, partial [Fibrobacteria bacterium]